LPFQRSNSCAGLFLRRTVGFGKLFSDEENLEEGTLDILLIDIKELGKMNNAVDEAGNKAADLILNIMAAKFRLR